MRVTLNDGRQMTGQMLAFDKVRLFCLFRIILGLTFFLFYST
jgi:hypothetical protein